MIHPQCCGRTGSSLLRALAKEKCRGFLLELDPSISFVYRHGCSGPWAFGCRRGETARLSSSDWSHTNIFLGSLAYQ